MEKNPTMQDVRDAKKELDNIKFKYEINQATDEELEKAEQKYKILHHRWQYNQTHWKHTEEMKCTH